MRHFLCNDHCKGIVFLLDAMFLIMFVGVLITAYSSMEGYPESAFTHNHLQHHSSGLVTVLKEGGHIENMIRLQLQNPATEEQYFQNNVQGLIEGITPSDLCSSLDIFIFQYKIDGSFDPVSTISHTEGCTRKNEVASNANAFYSPNYFAKIVYKVGERS